MFLRLFALFVTLLFMFVSPGISGPEGVVKTIPSPDFPYGLTFDGHYLWVGTSYANSAGDFLWQIDTTNGSVVNTIPVPDPNGFYTVKALAFDGSNLWVFEDLPSASHPDKIYKINPSNGNILKTLNAPDNNYMGGMAFGNGSLWLSQYYSSNASFNNVIHQIDTSNGSVVQTFSSVGEQPMGVAYDGQFVWCAEDTGFGATRQEIYQYDPASGTYTGTFIKNPDNSPRDMTWDGQYLWMVGYNSRLLYQISIAGGTPQIQLSSNSLNYCLVSIGDSLTQTINITNAGDADLIISTAQFDTSVFFSENLSLPLQIPAGGSYAMDITFAPVASGLVNGSLQIGSNDPLHPTETVTLSGQGQFVNPTIWLSASAHNYGNVWVGGDGVSRWVLRIANTGISSLEIVDLNLNISEFYVGGYSGFPITIAPNDTFDLSVFFQPSAAQPFTDTLSIESTDPSNPFVFVELTGTGQAGPFNLGYQFWNFQVPDNPVTSFNEYRPLALKSIEDVTGDGSPDVLIASHNYWTICLDGAGSGMTHEVWRFSSYISNFSAGDIGNTNDPFPQQKALSISEDLNNDGFQDVVIGTGGGNEHVYTLDGTNGSIIWQFGTDHPDSFGLGDITSVNTDEDFNGDGVKDVLATGSAADESGLTGRRSIYCFNGPDGSSIWQYFIGSHIRDIAVLGDVNINGHTDVVIGTGNGALNSYSVVAVESSGPTGPTLIWSFPIGSGPGGCKNVIRFNVPNETADVIAGEYFGSVYRLDGEFGTQVWQFSLGSTTITYLSIIEDVDGDGLDDVLVCSYDNSFYCVSGANGNQIWSRFFGDFTWSSQAIPDLNGDQQQDVVVACRNDVLYVLDGTDGTSLLEYPMNSGMLQGARLANILPDLDNNNSYEILGASEDGKIVALSGGTGAVTGIKQDLSLNIPKEYRLNQNYPNPFNPSTTISFDLPEAARVEIKIYDILGRLIRSFEFNSLPAGIHEVVWNGKDRNNINAPSGIYIYLARLNEHKISKQMLLLK
jgi:outer membrane protein assembly factor BamB